MFSPPPQLLSPNQPLPLPAPIIENRWRNNNRFCVFQGCGIALNYEGLEGRTAPVTPVTCAVAARLVFFHAANEPTFARTTRQKKSKFKNITVALEAAPHISRTRQENNKRNCRQHLKKSKQRGWTHFVCWTFPPQTKRLFICLSSGFATSALGWVTFIWSFFIFSAGRMLRKCTSVCCVVSGYVPCHVCAINTGSPG